MSTWRGCHFGGRTPGVGGSWSYWLLLTGGERELGAVAEGGGGRGEGPLALAWAERLAEMDLRSLWNYLHQVG